MYAERTGGGFYYGEASEEPRKEESGDAGVSHAPYVPGIGFAQPSATAAASHHEPLLQQPAVTLQYAPGPMSPKMATMSYPVASASTYQSPSTHHFAQPGAAPPPPPTRFDNIDISANANGFNVTPFERVHEFVSVSNKAYQNLLDSTTPHTAPRWLAFAFLLCVFMLRVVLYQGFYVVAYALGIYLLNIFLLFLSPKFDPAFSEDASALDNDAYLDDVSGDASALPSNLATSPRIDEFRPFIRRLPEFKFWHSAISAVLCGLVCTIFPVFDIPVFWPILLMYFVLLFGLTMRRQIQHMVKYKYLPFDIGKKAYA